MDHYPPQFIGSRAHLVDAFCDVAKEYGLVRSEAEDLFRHLPQGVKFAPAHKDKLSNTWRYSVGDPFDGLPGDMLVAGTTQLPTVEALFLTVRAASIHFKPEDLDQVLARLNDDTRHQDVLFEFAPLTQVSNETEALFEAEGIGAGDRKIDWLFTLCGRQPIAVEVKYRIADLINHMTDLLTRIQNDLPTENMREPDPALLFRSVIPKFQECSPDVRLQGAWIHPHIRLNEEQLQQHFDDLDPKKLHFVVIADWEPGAFVLARNESIREGVISFFGLVHSRRFILDPDETTADPKTHNDDETTA